MMGQHLASLRFFFVKMDADKAIENGCETEPRGTDAAPSSVATEDNGNEPSASSETEENKTDENLNVEEFPLDNHNSIFESIYSKQIDAPETKPQTNNGNFETPSENRNEPGSSHSSASNSSSSSSSEESPTNVALRRTSKTLSFGNRRGENIRLLDTFDSCDQLFRTFFWTYSKISTLLGSKFGSALQKYHLFTLKTVFFSSISYCDRIKDCRLFTTRRSNFAEKLLLSFCSMLLKCAADYKSSDSSLLKSTFARFIQILR